MEAAHSLMILWRGGDAGCGAWTWGKDGRRKLQKRKQLQPLSIWDCAVKQLSPGAAGILGTMALVSKKDLKIAMEVFAIFQWALSAWAFGESSAFGSVTNSPGLPGTQGL